MAALGRHILLELYGCPPSVLNDAVYLERRMVDAARAAEATVINTAFHHFSPCGVSGVVVIQESHFSIHTWPEHGYAAVDLFTCGDRIDPWLACNALKAALRAADSSAREIGRGQVARPAKPDAPAPQTAPQPSEYRNIWFTKKDDDIALSLRHSGALFSRQSPYQKVEVLDTYGYGKMLVIDGAVMCTERDESAYHEMIVHVPALTHPGVERALIIGGGDGGAAREMLRHGSLREVTVVEIDAVVVEAAREHFPDLASAFEDPRLTLTVEDGLASIRNCPSEAFDLVLVDVTHPTGPAEALFSQPFYEQVHRCLKPDGIMAAQTEPPALYAETFRQIHRRQRAAFGPGKVHCYLAFMPTYTTGMLSFSYASKGARHPLADLHPGRARAFATEHGLQYYNEDIHRSAFALPTFLRNLLSD